MQRRALAHPAFDHRTALGIGRFDSAPLAQEFQHLIEVPRCHRTDQRHIACQVGDHLNLALYICAAIVFEVLLDELEPLSDASRHRRLDPFPVSLELLDHEFGNKEFHVPLMHQKAERDDPALPVTSLGQVEPRRRVNE